MMELVYGFFIGGYIILMLYWNSSITTTISEAAEEIARLRKRIQFMESYLWGDSEVSSAEKTDDE